MPNLLGFQSQVVTDAYRTMVRATWPTALKVIHPGGVDAGLLREWRARRPDGLLVFRHYFPDENLDPSKIGQAINACDQIADLRPILECPINEAHQTSPDDIARLADYSVRFVQACAIARVTPAVGVFSEGNPADLAWWERFHPALRAARANGGYLALHEYGVPSLGMEDWHLLRHRRVWPVLPEDCRVPIIVSEGGIDGGIEGRREQGWRAYMEAPAYAGWLRTYHREIAQDPYVHGTTLFLCGSNQQWSSFDLRDEVDLRPPLTENLSMPARWTPEEPTVPDITLSTPVTLALASPANYQKGPRARTLGVVIHTTRGGAATTAREYTATVAWFQNPAAQVSAHLVVGASAPIGTSRCVHDDDVAWHARAANATHLGIEIAQARPGDPITDYQYQVAAEACRKWARRYGFPLERRMTITQAGLIGHEDSEPGKLDGKTDPGPLFDWPKFLALCTGGTMPDDPNALRDQTYALAEQLQALGPKWQGAGYPQMAEYVRTQGEAIKRTAVIQKGEK